jgi:hypothetical protein
MHFQRKVFLFRPTNNPASATTQIDMKMKLGRLGSLLILVLATLGAQAAIVFQDNFPYPSGPIGIASGGGTNGGGGIWVSGAGSTYGTTADVSATGANALSILGSSTSDLPRVYFTNGLAGFSMPKVPLFTNQVFYFPTNAPVAALYVSFNLNVTSGVTNTYIAYFSDTNFDFPCRIFLVTNTAAAGSYRMALDNNSAPSVPINSSNILGTDLTYGTSYTVVVRYALASGQTALWVNPANEAAAGLVPSGAVYLGGVSVTNISGTNSMINTSVAGFGVRNHIGGGPLTLSSLIIGTSFADVVSSSDGANPPFVAVAPVGVTNFVGGPATLTVVAGGDQDTITYQWFDGSTPISGATSSSYTIPSLAPTDAGVYSVTIANTAGTVTAGNINVGVISSSALPTINTQPANQTVTLAGSANFSVTATDGGPPLTYQWFLGSKALTGQTNASLGLGNVTFAQAGNYTVQVSNANGTTTSGIATLTVNSPASVNIAYLHTLLDTNYSLTNTTSLFTIKGVVTTWHDMTSAGNSEFYIQDATGGICVYWSGAASSTNLPPAGAMVQVTAPLSQFDGLLEIEPVFNNAFHSVTILSTNNPLPAAQPLPFDTLITTNPAIMVKHLQGSYIVASNVFLDLADGPNFTANANDPATNGFTTPQDLSLSIFTPSSPTAGTTSTVTFTNQAGETFIFFYNSYCDYIGQPKPTGPVTVYGVMGQFVTTSPYTSGYEFTPSRLADFIGPVNYTNVISNVVRRGDLNPNTFNQNVLQPGETLTMAVSINDPAGGNVSITPTATTPSGGGGAWTVTSTGGSVATASYTFTAGTANAGINYTNGLQYTISSGTFTYNWTVYVPTTDEQNVRITEVLPSPTSNSNSPAYNPLKRPNGAAAVIANDEYVEITSVAADPIDLYNWTIVNGSGVVLDTFANGGTPEGGNEELSPGSAGIIYGGLLNSDPNGPTLDNTAFFPEPADGNGSTGGLVLSAAGGVLSLFDGNGYLVDRVSYPATTTVGSFSRFPTINGPLVSQAYISTNLVTPGLQYDGGLWTSPTTVPTGVTNISITYGNPLTLNFTANTGKASTLWEAGSVTNQFNVVTGQQFGTTAGSFSVTNPPPSAQFYFITTQ